MIRSYASESFEPERFASNWTLVFIVEKAFAPDGRRIGRVAPDTRDRVYATEKTHSALQRYAKV